MSTSKRSERDDREQLRQELLELHFGCHPELHFGRHPEPDSLTARLAKDPELQALYEEVREMADLLHTAAKDKTPALDLHPREATPAKKRNGLRFGRGFLLSAAALLLICLVPAGFWGWNAHNIHQLKQDNMRLVVSLPPAVPDGAPLRFHVETRDLADQSLHTNVAWEVLGPNKKPLARGSSSCAGAMSVDIAGNLNRPRLVKVTATHPENGQQQTANLAIHPLAAAPMVYLATDKPAYRPGEPVLLRAAVLDRLTLQPRARQSLRYRITNPRGGVVTRIHAPMNLGVVAQTWKVPDDAPGGEYAFEVRDPGDKFTLERTPIFVRRFQPPKLKKDITLDQKTYTAGTSGNAEVRVARIAGGIPAGARIHATLIVDGKSTWQQEGRVDTEGRCVFRFPVPAKVDRGAARFVARITDGGVIETQLKPFVIPTEKLNVELSPEGGHLVANIQNRVYAQVTDALDRPITARGQVVDEAGTVVSQFETQHQGRGRFTLTPSAGVKYRVQLSEPFEKSFNLPTITDNAVGLQSKRDVFTADETIDLTIHTPDAGPWICGVFCRGILVGQENLRSTGSADVSIKILPEAWGVLRVTVFDNKLQPVAERLIQRETDRKVAIALTPEKKKLAPGEKQKIKITTTDETGEPVAGLLGVTVTDQAVADMLDHTHTGIVDHVGLLEDVDTTELEDVDEFLARTEHKNARRNVDLLLGSLSWRRFAWQGKANVDTLVKIGGEWARGLSAREGNAFALMVKDVRPDIVGLLSSTHRSRRLSRDLTAALGVLCLVVLGLMVFFKVAWWISSRVPHRTEMFLLRGTAVAAVPILLAVVFNLSVSHLSSARADGAAPGAELLDVAREVAFAFQFEGEGKTNGAIRDFDVELAQAARVPLVRSPQSRQPRAPEPGAPSSAAPTTPGPPTPDAAVQPDPAAGLVLIPEATQAAQPSPEPVAHLVSGNPFARQWAATYGLREIPVNFYAQAETTAGKGLVEEIVGGDEFFLGPTRRVVKVDRSEQLANRKEYYFRDRAAEYFRLLETATRRIPAFAYKHETGGGQTRSSFTETLFWQPFLLTDDKGEVTVEFDVNDSVTTWKVYADAFTRGRVGQAESEFQVELPFHMDFKVPVEVTQGDQLQLPVSIVSTDKGDAEATIKIQAAGPLALGDSIKANTDQVIKLLDGRGRLLVPVTCFDTRAPGVIGISGAVRAAQDRITRGIRIVPRGFPKDITKGGTIDGKAGFKIKLPKDLVKGSGKATLRLYPSTLSTIQGGLSGILREPHGCFEQTSSSNYPNTMVLTYLEASGDNIPSMANRARQLLPRGYNRLAGYECSTRGYEWWGKNPGHDTLTAYGLMQFHDMRKVYSGVDAGMITRTRDWLLSKRDGKGGFKRDHGGHDHFAHSPNELANAYILWSLTTTGTPPATLKVELDALAGRLEQSKDPYELALIACAMHEAGKTESEREDQARVARSKLARLQNADGSLAGATTITQSGGRDLVVETTSLAVLAWVTDGDGKYTGEIHKAIDYICTGRKGSGSFGATQATILALKALTVHAGTTQQVKDGEIRVFSGPPRAGETEIARQAFTRHQAGPTVIDLTKELMGALGGEQEIRMEITGGGKLPWTCDLSYHAEQPADDDDCQVAIETFLSKVQVEEGGTVALTVRVDNRLADKPLPMTMAIVGLPAGLHVAKDVLDDLKKAEQFDFYELRGREVILYWRGMTKGQRRQVVLDLTARIPGTTTGPASRAYLYYTPDQKRWAQPLKVTVRPGR